jgi:hypothetical protein
VRIQCRLKRLPTQLVAFDELNPTIFVGTRPGQTNLLVNGGLSRSIGTYLIGR